MIISVHKPKKNVLFLLTSFIGVIFFVLIFLYLGYTLFYSFNDPFLSRLNKNSVFYMRVYKPILRKSSQESYKHFLELLTFSDLSVLDWELLNHDIEQFALVLSPNSRRELVPYFYILPENKLNLIQKLNEGQTPYISMDDFFILAKKKEDLDELRKSIANIEEDSLIKYNFSFLFGFQGYGFVDLQRFTDYTSKFGSIFNILKSNEDLGGRSYLKIKMVKDRISIHVNSNEIDDKSYSLKSFSSDYLDKLNYEDLNYYISFQNTYKALDRYIWGNYADVESYKDFIDQNKINFQKSVFNGFEIERVEKLLDQELIILNVGEADQSRFLGFMNVNPSDIDLIRYLFKIYYGLEHPGMKKAYLPDGAHVYELRAFPEDYNYEDLELNSSIQELVDSEGKSLDFYYTLVGNQLMFGNSIDLILNLADEQVYAETDFYQSLNKDCNVYPMFFVKSKNPIVMKNLVMGFSNKGYKICINY